MAKARPRVEIEKKAFPILICAVYDPDSSEHDTGLVWFASKQEAINHIAEANLDLGPDEKLEIVATYNLAGLKRMYTKVVEEDVE